MPNGNVNYAKTNFLCHKYLDNMSMSPLIKYMTVKCKNHDFCDDLSKEEKKIVCHITLIFGSTVIMQTLNQSKYC